MFRRLLAAVLFATTLAACGSSSCTPAAAYTIPAHWERAHYAYEQSYNWQTGKYYWHRVYVSPSYHPAQPVPAVVCSSR